MSAFRKVADVKKTCHSRTTFSDFIGLTLPVSLNIRRNGRFRLFAVFFRLETRTWQLETRKFPASPSSDGKGGCDRPQFFYALSLCSHDSKVLLLILAIHKQLKCFRDAQSPAVTSKFQQTHPWQVVQIYFASILWNSLSAELRCPEDLSWLLPYVSVRFVFSVRYDKHLPVAFVFKHLENSLQFRSQHPVLTSTE